jgi:energy-coupling factor transport system ATP-binding protein
VPSRGNIYLQGRSILGHNTVELAKAIAYLPQYPDDLLFADTVEKELEITLQNHGMEAGNNVTAMLSDLNLEKESQKYPRDLSTGQRQRVALGAIMIAQPQILLLDEPTRGLDGRLKYQLVEKWRNWSEKGMAIVLVTHDVEMAAQLADDVLILDEGKVSAFGAAREILAQDSWFSPQMARLFPETGWLTPVDVPVGLMTE